MFNKSLFSSRSDNWETPQEVFDYWNNIYQFNVDVCADEHNHKCPFYYSKEDDGLTKDWFGSVWCNPPYGKDISKWIEKAYNEWKDNGTDVVMLLPSRTDTKWFHNYILPFCEIVFIKGRLKFNNSKTSAPFPSMIAIFKGE